MSRVGQVRFVDFPTKMWCDTTKESTIVPAGHALLVIDDPGYCRTFCLDDGRLYNVSHDCFSYFKAP